MATGYRSRLPKAASETRIFNMRSAASALAAIGHRSGQLSVQPSPPFTNGARDLIQSPLFLYTLKDTKPSPMCTNTIEFDGVTVACRKCNDCIKTRKNGWVARAMAERSTSAQTFSVTLTYNDETEENRDGSTAFEYRHIKLWLKKLRRSIEYRTGDTGSIRFIACGEKGSLLGRCHWHVILFSNADVLRCGEFRDFFSRKVVTQPDQIISQGKPVKKLSWTMWPHGFCSFQEPDQWGMEYALKYALKDQMNTVSAAGTMRETKVENFSAGYFRMSKRPPIGAAHLDEYLDRLFARNSVPVTLNIPVPDYTGFWYPTRTMREHMLNRIKEFHDDYRERHGKDAPQWRALLATLADNETDLELLNGQEETEAAELEELEDFQRKIHLRSREIREQQETTATRNKCGGLVPCDACRNALSGQQFDQLTRWAEKEAAAHGGYDAADAARRRENRRNPFCGVPDGKAQKRAFPKGA